MSIRLLYVIVATFAIFFLPKPALADFLNEEPKQAAPPAAGSSSVSSVSTSSALTPKTSTSLPPALQVDNHDAGWTWNKMVEYSDPFLFQKSGYAGGPGSYGVYTFNGTGVEITGIGGPTVTFDGVSHAMGSVVVFIDGKQVAKNCVLLKQVNYRDSLFKIDGLAATNHVLHIEPADGWIVVNYITVLNTPAPVESAAAAGQNSGDAHGSSGPAYRLIPQGTSTLCMDVVPGPLKGAAVQLWDIDPTRMQAWTLNPLGGNKWTLSPAGHPEVVLWVVPLSPDNKAAQLFLWPYTGAPNEVLTINTIQTNPLECTMTGQGTNMTVGVWHNGFGDGAQVVGDTLSYVYGQKWTVQQVNN